LLGTIDSAEAAFGEPLAQHELAKDPTAVVFVIRHPHRTLRHSQPVGHELAAAF
jgi:hypothetical protein